MLRTVSLSLLTLALCACSASDSDTAATSAAATAFQTEDEKTLYALGIAIGQNVQQNVRDFNLTPAELELVASGLNDAMRGVEPKVDFQVYAALIQPFAQQRMMAAAAEAASAEKAESAAWVAEMAKEPGAEQSASGIVFIPIVAGTGANPTPTSTVKVHYHGTLRDGTVFDSSLEREPISFGLNQVIPCWTEGVQKIKVGGKAKLVCPSDTAYGDQGSGAEIAGGAALAFEVELLEIE